VIAPLTAMGAAIGSVDGHPPLTIDGARLRGIAHVPEVPSAQVKSAVLLAGLHADGRTSVTEPAPTRDHTERALEAFGVPVWRDGGAVSVEGGHRLRAIEAQVPGDFSSAAFFIVAGCLAATSGLKICRVGINPTRTGLLDMLRLMGAQITVTPLKPISGEPLADISVRAGPLKGAVIPPDLVPLAIDELPVLFIAAACATGETLVTGASELRVKESDRLAVMAEGLSALGVRCELLADGIRIQGGGLHGGRVDSHGDHRVAMAFAMASLRASGSIQIEDVANVATSFPGFDAVARQAGLALSEVDGP